MSQIAIFHVLLATPSVSLQYSYYSDCSDSTSRVIDRNSLQIITPAVFIKIPIWLLVWCILVSVFCVMFSTVWTFNSHCFSCYTLFLIWVDMGECCLPMSMCIHNTSSQIQSMFELLLEIFHVLRVYLFVWLCSMYGIKLILILDKQWFFCPDVFCFVSCLNNEPIEMMPKCDSCMHIIWITYWYWVFLKFCCETNLFLPSNVIWTDMAYHSCF